MQPHSFYIPVMGIAFTIDTPIRVAHLGIDSVISIVDDGLIETVRSYYAKHFQLPFTPITAQEDDARARRITAYLDMVKEITERKFNQLFTENPLEGAGQYLRLLPEKAKNTQQAFKDWVQEVRNTASIGSIDVNIMTKLDKVNYKAGQALDRIYNDAHAALRGFAESKLSSRIILSAGLNPALFAYMQQFDGFFPNESGHIAKKIVLKVSDYRSALIQGKYLAKNGLWVSEFRIESGLNCGGHAFATDGLLMGPILEEFKQKREELKQELNSLFLQGLEKSGRVIPRITPEMRITAQGGVGTADEHQFLIDHYGLDAVGWGSPFLLVPEATSLDTDTRYRLQMAEEKDLYLSKISPLGVPFNNLRTNTKDEDKYKRIEAGKAGVPCTREYLKSNTEFSEQPICTASRKYQSQKIKELQAANLAPQKLEKAIATVTEKACICTGLGSPFMLEHSLDLGKNGPGTSVCPGPNMAYYNRQYSLQEMIDHIYGRVNIIERSDRPNVFIKELQQYLSYFKDQIDEVSEEMNARAKKKMEKFADNLEQGIAYYESLQDSANQSFKDFGQKWSEALQDARKRVQQSLSHLS